MENKLIVTAAPHITSGDSTQKIMGRVCLALCPALVASVIVFGINALILTAVTVAASQGNFQLNVFLPVCAYNFMLSARLLTDAMDSFRIHCVDGITADERRMAENLNRSLMLVTCLTPEIGYEKAARCAKKALRDGSTLKEAVLALGYLDEAAYDTLVRPEKMV